jgi:hypothetical protein
MGGDLVADKAVHHPEKSEALDWSVASVDGVRKGGLWWRR